MPTVSSGQPLDISAAESSAGVQVLSGGILRVLSGGTAGGKVLSGGEQIVAQGGMAQRGVRRQYRWIGQVRQGAFYFQQHCREEDRNHCRHNRWPGRGLAART